MAGVSAPYARPSTLSAHQFVSLRAFQPQYAVTTRQLYKVKQQRGRPVESHATAAGVAELLQGAQLLVPAGGPLPAQLDQLPPYEEWHRHPDLLQGCEPGGTALRVAVLLSGGVDSSLALHLLKAAGHEVTAFYLQIWFQEDFRNFWDACPWEEDLQYCQAVCDRLGVELRMVPLTEQYWDRVVAHCISEIKQGRTPNPDVLCNSRVKFGAFYEYLESEHGGTFDRVASGHYARIDRVPLDGVPAAAAAAAAGGAAAASEGLGEQVEARLALTPDAVKDQTYFLAHLNQHQLARTLFPLGHLTKPQVRALAAAADLPNKARKDSQGICFLGKVKFSEFIREHLGEWPGPIVEEESDEVLGYHRGFWFHTVGQRKGIPLSGGPWYVTRKNPDSNAVYVSRQYYEHNKVRNSFTCGPISWCSSVRPSTERPLYCKVRHGPNMYCCELTALPGAAAGQQGELAPGSSRRGGSQAGASWHVQLDGNDQGLAAGQYAVFYQDGTCLGSAVIAGCDAFSD